MELRTGDGREETSTPSRADSLNPAPDSLRVSLQTPHRELSKSKEQAKESEARLPLPTV